MALYRLCQTSASISDGSWQTYSLGAQQLSVVCRDDLAQFTQSNSDESAV